MSPLRTPILPMLAVRVAACGEAGPETEAAAVEDSPGLPGNRVAHGGLPERAARDAIIALLLQTTESKAVAEGA